MPELRTDWLTGRTVLLAENRAERPNEFATERIAPSDASGSPVDGCPFCPDHEAMTPEAVYTHSNRDGRWQVRVVPNKFPAVVLDPAATDGMQAAVGVQEVVIDAPRHIDQVSALSAGELHEVLVAYASRLNHWRDDDRFEYGLVFKNVGPRAGATLSHLHSQLIALPKAPPSQAAEHDRAAQSFAEHGTCPYCRLLNDERAADRIVHDGDGFVAFCPYASLQPGEVWIMPAAHEPWFERRAADPRHHLAIALHAILSRIESVLPVPAYNLILRTAPWHGRDGVADWGHWRIEILPRVNSLAGLELATGIHINPISPSTAAKTLRSS